MECYSFVLPRNLCKVRKHLCFALTENILSLIWLNSPLVFVPQSICQNMKKECIVYLIRLSIDSFIQSMGIFCAVHYFFQIEKNVLRCISSYANLNPSCVWRWLQLLSCGLHSFLLFCNFYLFIMSWQWSMICTMFLVTSSQSQLNSNYIWRRDN